MKLSVLPVLALGVDAGCVAKFGWSPSFSNFGALGGGMQAILKNGDVFAWGDNTFAGTGAFDAAAPAVVTRPYMTRGLNDVTGLRASDHHTCALLANGTAMCWGNEMGAGYVGNGVTVMQYNLPINPVNLPDAYLDLTTGEDTTCVVKLDGTVWCLGAAWTTSMALNGVGTTDSAIPVAVTGPTGVTGIAGGYKYHCSSSSSNGIAWCWGDNTAGQLGNGAVSAGGIYMLPGTTWGDVKPGYLTTCGYTTTGLAYCWGDNSQGQIGDGTTTPRYVPTLVSAINGLGWVVKILPGYDHVCALNNKDELWCWGDNANGELGTGLGVDWLVPTRPVLYDVADFQLSFSATCAVTKRGSVYCWGSQTPASLGGLANTADELVPELIPDEFFGCESKSKSKNKVKAAAPAKKAKKVAGAVGGAVLGVAIAGYAIRRLRKRNYVPLATATTAV
jgi:alpha-tubulin suppressor-like RCC1 family protein